MKIDSYHLQFRLNNKFLKWGLEKNQLEEVLQISTQDSALARHELLLQQNHAKA